MNKKERLEKFNNIDIYPITCERLSKGRSNFDFLDAVIKGGASIIQFREKELRRDEFLSISKKFREITAKNNILLIINDYIDIALEVGADGVHLGQEDMPVKKARELAHDLIIGASITNLKEALQAEIDGADYVNIGPIFKTNTKENTVSLGIEAIKKIVPKLSVPFTVIGGINLENLDEVLQAGAEKIAVITAITQAEDIAKTTKEFIKKITPHLSSHNSRL